MSHIIPSARIIERYRSRVSNPFFLVQIDRLTQIPIVNRFKFPFSWWVTVKIRNTKSDAHRAINEYLGIGAYDLIWYVTLCEPEKNDE
jgi:hypothetical protein